MEVEITLHGSRSHTGSTRLHPWFQLAKVTATPLKKDKETLNKCLIYLVAAFFIEIEHKI